MQLPAPVTKRNTLSTTRGSIGHVACGRRQVLVWHRSPDRKGVPSVVRMLLYSLFEQRHGTGIDLDGLIPDPEQPWLALDFHEPIDTVNAASTERRTVDIVSPWALILAAVHLHCTIHCLSEWVNLPCSRHEPVPEC